MRQIRTGADSEDTCGGAAQTGTSEHVGALSSTSSDVAARQKSSAEIPGVPVPKPFLLLRSPLVRYKARGKNETDSLVDRRVSEWFSGGDFSRVNAFLDSVGEGIHKVASVPPPKEEKNPVQFDFLPTETHVQTMAVLYKKGKATQKDLYLALDPSVPMTAELFNRNLDLLVEKGFLTRKKISPENIFNIAIPFVTIPIEMSRKNRLNPVYQYMSQVDKQKLLAYLQSNQFLLTEKMKKASPADSVLILSLISRCEREITILAK